MHLLNENYEQWLVARRHQANLNQWLLIVPGIFCGTRFRAISQEVPKIESVTRVRRFHSRELVIYTIFRYVIPIELIEAGWRTYASVNWVIVGSGLQCPVSISDKTYCKISQSLDIRRLNYRTAFKFDRRLSNFRTIGQF